MLPLPLLSFKQQVRARSGDDYSGQSLGDYSEQGLEALEKLRSHVRAYLWRRDIQKKDPLWNFIGVFVRLKNGLLSILSYFKAR